MAIESINSSDRLNNVNNINNLYKNSDVVDDNKKTEVEANKKSANINEDKEDEKKNKTHTETVIEGKFVYIYLVKGDRSRQLIQKIPFDEYKKQEENKKQTNGVSKSPAKFNEALVFMSSNKENSRNLYKTLNHEDKDTLNGILEKLKNKDTL